MVELLPNDLVSLLELRAHEAPHRQAFRYLGATEGPSVWTYRGLRDAANVVAHTIERDGGRGERVLLLFPPGLEFIQAFLGTVSAGAIAVPAPPPNPHKPKQSLQRLAAIVASARPTRALTLGSTLKALQPAIAELPEFDAISWIATDELPAPPAGYQPRGVADRGDIALIQYTSGSTSDPKGAALSHENLMHNLRYFDVGWDHSPDSVTVNWLPAFHDLGLVYGILAPIWGGFASIQMSPIDVIQRPLVWLRAISDQRATHSCGPNFIYELCARKVSPAEVRGLDLRSWRMALTAAEPVRADTMRKFVEHFAPAGFNPRSFCPGYGLSEGTCKVTAVPWHEQPTVLSVRAEALERHEIEVAAPGPGALEVVGCGRPAFGVGVAVVDPDTREWRGPEEVGEIWVSGPSIARSYWEAPDATERELRATMAGRPDTPFLRTGDLGFLHDGELFITGRIKDMIIVRGANHYPQDIEYTVQDAHAAVRAGCVAAFAIEDDGEEQLVVVAEIDRGRNGDGPDASPSDVTKAVVRAVAEEHGLRVARVALVPAHTIPKTTSGKIQRRATRQALVEGRLQLLCDERRPSSQPAVAMRDHIRARVTDIVSEVGAIPFERLRPTESLHGLGVDSLAGVNIAYEIGLMTGRDVPAALLDERDTIEKLVDYVVALGGAR
ncbi:MAG: AMP-dependent synthetase [Deltaproteobacteria bacterium HGW-Deltaproteobacteria-14]|jgi:acyl-CoA synthetase (AMP-forming)/AMP-acid ligase II/acyl carrier protein|nr:MAG: AMP-dependent synthetase [Deltaproteobacteria bacterium HGW-Deltaproteobacteria-14]